VPLLLSTYTKDTCRRKCLISVLPYLVCLSSWVTEVQVKLWFAVTWANSPIRIQRPPLLTVEPRCIGATTCLTQQCICQCVSNRYISTPLGFMTEKKEAKRVNYAPISAGHELLGSFYSEL